MMLILCGFQACDLTPNVPGGLAEFSVVCGGEKIAGKVVEIVNRIVNGCEALRMSFRFKRLHDLLTSPDRLMRILAAIV